MTIGTLASSRRLYCSEPTCGVPPGSMATIARFKAVVKMGNTKLTGFVAESWHFRYVGVEAAQTMTQNNWCLEEYVEKMGL